MSPFPYRHACLLLALATMSLAAAPAEIRICPFKDNKSAAVSLTFDDGLLDHSTVVQPMLKEADIPGTFFIVPKYTDSALSQRDDPSKRQFMTWDQVRSIAEDGHEIANHSSTHANLREANDELLYHEVVDSITDIESQTGQRPVTFCFPGNSRDQRALDYVLEHHINARTYQYGIGRKFEIAKFDDWLNQLVAKREWGVAMIHSIVDDFNGYDPLPEEEEDFAKLLASLKSSQDDIWTDTFADVSKYVQLRDSSSIEWLYGRKQFIVKTDLDTEVYDIPLTVEVIQDGISTYREVPVNEPILLP